MSFAVKPPRKYRAPYVMAVDHASVTADTTIKFDKLAPGERLRVAKVYYVNPTGLTQDSTNHFALRLKKGSTTVASWSTQTGQQGSIAAATFVELVIVDAQRVVEPGSELSLELDETGTQTLPAGRLIVHGELI